MSDNVIFEDRSRWRGHARALVFACGLVLLQITDAAFAAPFDGEWTGSATATSGGCKPAAVTLIAAGRDVAGQVKFEQEAQDINGTLREDGTFAATIGFNPLNGKFAGDTAEGSFRSRGCIWRMILKAKRP